MSTDLGPYCIQYTEYRLPKNISRQNSRQQKSRLAVKPFFDSTIYIATISRVFFNPLSVFRVQDESHQEQEISLKKDIQRHSKENIHLKSCCNCKIFYAQ